MDDTTTHHPLQGLTFLWLEITAKCNLECIHCYADSGPHQSLLGQMKTEDWLRVMHDAAHIECQQVQFIGGEPTLHPDLPQMISFASSLNYRFIEVFTNAVTINDNLLQIFVKYGVHIATSFYSDNPKIHDMITKHQGSFTRTVRGIKRVLAAGLPIRVGIIEMKENSGHALKAKRFLENIGVSQIKIDSQRGVGRGMRSVHLLNPMAELCGECWKGKLCVTSSGKAYPCVFSRFVDLGDVKNGIHSITSNNGLSSFRASYREFCLKQGLSDCFVMESISVGSDKDSSFSSNTLDDLSLNPCIPNRVCAPACQPTCSPCPPVSFCAPMSEPCSPDRSCNPTSRPCSPDRSCNPSIELG